VRTRAAALALIAGLWAAPALAQDGPRTFAPNPNMTRGPATAPITIVEFSDYQ